LNNKQYYVVKSLDKINHTESCLVIVVWLLSNCLRMASMAKMG
jgi:hypothetical protein